MMNSQMDQLWKNDQKVINLIFVQNCDKWFHNCKALQKYSLTVRQPLDSNFGKMKLICLDETCLIKEKKIWRIPYPPFQRKLIHRQQSYEA